MKPPNALWLVLGAVVGAILLTLTLRQVNIGEAIETLHDVRSEFVLLAIAASLGFVLFKAWRWSALLRPFLPLSMRQLLPVVFSGAAVNLLVPHLGELVRIVSLRSRQPIPAGVLLSSIGIERVFDFIAVTVLVGVVVLRQPAVPSVVVSAGYAALALSGVLLFCVLGVLYFPRFVQSLASACTRLLPARARASLDAHVTDVIAGFASLRSAHVVALAAVCSLAQWSMIVVGAYASIHALGIDAPAAAAVMVLALMVVGLTLPAAPINVGTTQVAFMLGLASFAVPAANAVAASVVYTAAVLCPMLLIGLACLYGGGLRLKALVAGAKLEQQNGN